MDVIADVAESLFQERGYTAITMREIAKAAGMRQASLYYHFPESNYLCLWRERMFERHRVGIQHALEQADKELRPQLFAATIGFSPNRPSIF